VGFVGHAATGYDHDHAAEVEHLGLGLDPARENTR